jgi:hypothetical protein
VCVQFSVWFCVKYLEMSYVWFVWQGWAGRGNSAVGAEFIESGDAWLDFFLVLGVLDNYSQLHQHTPSTITVGQLLLHCQQ